MHAEISDVLTGQVGTLAVLRSPCSGCYNYLELASTHGIAFRLAERRRTMETEQITVSALLLLLHDIICISQCASSSEALCLVAATIQQQSHNKLVSLCDGHGRFICCVGVFAPCFLSTQGIGTNALSHEG